MTCACRPEKKWTFECQNGRFLGKNTSRTQPSRPAESTKVEGLHETNVPRRACCYCSRSCCWWPPPPDRPSAAIKERKETDTKKAARAAHNATHAAARSTPKQLASTARAAAVPAKGRPQRAPARQPAGPWPPRTVTEHLLPAAGEENFHRGDEMQKSCQNACSSGDQATCKMSQMEQHARRAKWCTRRGGHGVRSRVLRAHPLRK